MSNIDLKIGIIFISKIEKYILQYPLFMQFYAIKNLGYRFLREKKKNFLVRSFSYSQLIRPKNCKET